MAAAAAAASYNESIERAAGSNPCRFPLDASCLCRTLGGDAQADAQMGSLFVVAVVMCCGPQFAPASCLPPRIQLVAALGFSSLPMMAAAALIGEQPVPPPSPPSRWPSCGTGPRAVSRFRVRSHLLLLPLMLVQVLLPTPRIPRAAFDWCCRWPVRGPHCCGSA